MPSPEGDVMVEEAGERDGSIDRRGAVDGGAMEEPVVYFSVLLRRA